MESRPTKNAVMATVNELAEYIREHAPIKFGALCVKMHVAPSTLHGWKRALLDTHEDIVYEHGVFKIRDPPRVET